MTLHVFRAKGLRDHGRIRKSLMAAALSLFLAAAHGVTADTIILAGGCFWCVESDFDSVDGVTSTISGYTGGTVDNPTYKIVTSGKSGHYEAVQITFDPNVVTLRDLLDKFWRSVDVTDDGGQFCDRGASYRTAIFTKSDDQRRQANASKADAEKALGQRIVTPILDVQEFYPAEDRHQNYHLGDKLVITRFGVIRQSEAYKRYRKGCGRDRRVRELWGDQAAFAK